MPIHTLFHIDQQTTLYVPSLSKHLCVCVCALTGGRAGVFSAVGGQEESATGGSRERTVHAEEIWYNAPCMHAEEIWYNAPCMHICWISLSNSAA